MKTPPYFIAALFLLAFAMFARAGEKETVTLFNGTDISAWKTDKPDGWKIEEGVLTPAGTKTGYIWTKDDYGDFVLELEVKMSENCNSGVFFRTDPKNPVQGGFEIQVFDSAGKKELDKHDCGALYDAKAPKVNAAKKPGEWNKFKITCKGPMVTVELNGQEVINANLDEWTTPNQNPDGSKNKFNTALKDLPRTGAIGLQEHGHPVWYRNITLKPL